MWCKDRWFNWHVLWRCRCYSWLIIGGAIGGFAGAYCGSWAGNSYVDIFYGM